MYEYIEDYAKLNENWNMFILEFSILLRAYQQSFH
jgi:hypothetical protein